MRKLTAFLLFILPMTISFGQQFNTNYGSPIIVLIETDPWLMVIGSDVPSFALYENGQIIYKRITDKKQKYFEIKLTRDETQALIKTFGISDNLIHQPNSIEASGLTDQPTNELILNFDTLRQISVYGNLRFDKSDARQKTPKCFLTVFDNLIKFYNKSAIEWLPDTFEIMLTSYSYSPEVPIKWPKDWADLNNPKTIKRSDNLYSVYLDKKYFKDFLKIINGLKEKQAVELNGQKFSVSYRLPFPNLK